MSARTPFPVFSAAWFEFWQQAHFDFVSATPCGLTGREFLNKIQIATVRDANGDWAVGDVNVLTADALAAGFGTLRDAEIFAADRLAVYFNNAITSYLAKCGSTLPSGTATSSAEVAGFLDAPPNPQTAGTNPPAATSVSGVSLVSRNVATTQPQVALAVSSQQPAVQVPLAQLIEQADVLAASSGATGGAPQADPQDGLPVVSAAALNTGSAAGETQKRSLVGLLLIAAAAYGIYRYGS